MTSNRPLLMINIDNSMQLAGIRLCIDKLVFEHECILIDTIIYRH